MQATVKGEYHCLCYNKEMCSKTVLHWKEEEQIHFFRELALYDNSAQTFLTALHVHLLTAQSLLPRGELLLCPSCLPLPFLQLQPYFLLFVFLLPQP